MAIASTAVAATAAVGWVWLTFYLEENRSPRYRRLVRLTCLLVAALLGFYVSNVWELALR